MKEALCKAFCNNLTVRTVPSGLAVSTGFSAPDGDKIGFYIVNGENPSLKRIEDSGTIYPLLEASGVDFKHSETRRAALDSLMEEHGVCFDEQDRRFFIEGVRERDVATMSLKFVSFCIRVHDFLLMTEYRVANTFREDAEKVLRQIVGSKAIIDEGVPLTPALADFIPDFVLRATGRPPVGIFLGTSEVRVLEAIVLHMRATLETHTDCSVAVLVERGSVLSNKVRQQATNRLSAYAEFRGDEEAAIQRIARDAIGASLH